jgi:hypothetical protein
MLLGWRQTQNALVHGVILSLSCVISYWLVTHLLSRSTGVSRDNDLLGGMWAAVATLFVYRFGYEQSIGAALSRVASTAVSFVLCLLYLLLFPFHLWGLAVLIGIGAVTMSMMGRPDAPLPPGSRRWSSWSSPPSVRGRPGCNPHCAWSIPS